MDLSIDLETLGNLPGCAFKQIGYAFFHLRHAYILEKGCIFVDLQSCLDAGLEVDASTIEWWFAQDDEARKMMQLPGIPLADALRQLTRLVERHKPERIWSRGPDFDHAILRCAYRAVGLPEPWKYNAARCVRTIEEICESKPVKLEGIPHFAQDDAVQQAMTVIGALVPGRLR